MLLTLPIILGVFSVLADDSARNIYARIRAFYVSNQNIAADWPDMVGGWFYGFYGVTKDVLIKTVEVLKDTAGWLTASNAERNLIFSNIANLVAEATKCDPEGVKKFCNFCFAASKKDASILKYFSNPDAKYTVFDKIADAVSDTATKTKDTVIDMAEYAVTPSATAKAGINPIIKYAIIGAVGYFVINKILK